MIESRFGERVFVCLLTRINICDPVHRLLASDRAKALGVIRSELVEKRLDLFRDHCLRSVGNLRPRPDLWLLLMDAETPPALLEQYRKEIAGRGEVQLLDRPAVSWCWNSRHYISQLAGALDDRLPAEVTHIATFGLDDDDALRANYFRTVASYVNVIRGEPLGEERTILNVPLGYVDTGKYVTVRFIRSNMFAGCIEPRARLLRAGECPVTIYATPHTALRQTGRICNIRTRRPAWIKISHAFNIAQRVDFGSDRDGVPVMRSAAETHAFGLESRSDAEEPARVVAARLRKARRHREALRSLREALPEAEDMSPATLHELALNFAGVGDAEGALSCYARAIALDNKWRASGYWLVEALLESGCFNAARNVEQQLRAVTSTCRFEERLSRGRMKRAAAACPDWAWPLVALAALALKGRSSRAPLTYAEEARQREVTWSPAWHVYGQALVRLDRYEDACRALERTVELDPTNALPWIELGYAACQEGRWETARWAFERGLARWVEGAPPEAAFVKLAASYRALRRNDEAIECLRRRMLVYGDSESMARSLEMAHA